MTYILAIETSTTNCSVGLIANGKCEAFIEENDGYSHAENLSVFIDELLTLHEIPKSDIQAVAVTKGPGSYTGLRIGVSTAKGICMALGIPLISVNALNQMFEHEALENLKFEGNLFYPMLDARRMEVYTKTMDINGNTLNEISAEIIDESFFEDESKNVILFGPGAEKFQATFQNIAHVKIIPNIFPSAQLMAKEVQQKFNLKAFEDLAYFEPFYLKEFVATKPKKLI